MTAEDGLSALQTLNSFTPDIMFIDLIMPNIGGEKLCGIIRSIPKFKDIFITILSGIAVEQNLDFIEVGEDHKSVIVIMNDVSEQKQMENKLLLMTLKRKFSLPNPQKVQAQYLLLMTKRL